MKLTLHGFVLQMSRLRVVGVTSICIFMNSGRIFISTTISKNSYCYNNWNTIFKQNDDNYSEAALLWSQGRHDEVQ